MENIATLQGIQYLVDGTGTRKAVVIDLEKWGALWEDFYEALIDEDQGHGSNIKSEIQQNNDPVLEKLAPLIEKGVIIPHTKKLKKASMPTIEVKGKPLSQIIRIP